MHTTSTDACDIPLAFSVHLMDTNVYCYCSKCPPDKIWKRRTVLIHLQEDNKRLCDPSLELSDLDELQLKLCIEYTGNSLAGLPPGRGKHMIIVIHYILISDLFSIYN